MLVHTKSPVDHRILARTDATALGDVLDKVARELIPMSEFENQPDDVPICYPFEFEQRAQSLFNHYVAPKSRQAELESYQSKDGQWELQPALRQSVEMKYDFNALCSTTLSILRERPEMGMRKRMELGTQFMRFAFEHLMSRVIIALKTDEDLLQDRPKTLILSGGVASNNFLRRVIQDTLEARGFDDIKLVVPRRDLCTDNAHMIAYAGWKMYTQGWETDKSFCPAVQWSIEEILSGVDCWSRRPGFPPTTPDDAQGGYRGLSQANSEAASAATSEIPEEAQPSSSVEREETLTGEASGFPSNLPSSRVETIRDETVESLLPGSTLTQSTPSELFEITSENSKKHADLSSKPSRENAIDKTTSDGWGEETDDLSLRLDRLLKKAESILSELEPTSRNPSASENKAGGGSQSKSQSRSAPDRAQAKLLDARAEARRAEREEAAATRHTAKPAAAKESSITETIPLANAPPVNTSGPDSCDSTSPILSPTHVLHRPPVLPGVRKPTAVPVAPGSTSSSNSSSRSAPWVKIWPPMPSPKERQELKIRYLGFADEPGSATTKSAPTFLRKIASMFGLGRKD